MGKGPQPTQVGWGEGSIENPKKLCFDGYLRAKMCVCGGGGSQVIRPHHSQSEAIPKFLVINK